MGASRFTCTCRVPIGMCLPHVGQHAMKRKLFKSAARFARPPVRPAMHLQSLRPVRLVRRRATYSCMQRVHRDQLSMFGFGFEQIDASVARQCVNGLRSSSATVRVPETTFDDSCLSGALVDALLDMSSRTNLVQIRNGMKHMSMPS